MSIVTLPSRALARLSKDWHRRRFAQVARQARLLPPIKRGHLPFVLLSMVHTRDVDAYLVAVQSFTQHVPPQRVVVVCDPSITDEDRAVLTAAVPHVELVRAVDFQDPALPVGGTWERLQAMAHYAREHYVVQLDSDTVTSGPLPEVVAAIAEGRAFTLGEMEGQTRVTHAEARETARRWQAPDVHIQGLVEFVLPDAQLNGAWYVRGCSGFFGIPPTPDLLSTVRHFSAEMKRLTGNRWSEWGSEQVTSNYVVAQYPEFEALAWPRFGAPEDGRQIPAFAHFIGPVRFKNSWYRLAAQRALRACALPRTLDER